MLQLVLTVIIFMIIVIPIGNYLYHIASGQRTFADPVFDRVDGGIFKVCGIHPDKGMNWKKALFYSFFGCITNILPILVLGFLLVLGVTGIFFVAGQLVDLLGLHSINMFIFFPLSCLVLTVIYATYWPMYEALFGGTRGKDSLKEEKSL